MKILITGANSAKALKLLKAFPNHFVLLADYGEVPGISTANYAFQSLGILNKESIAHILLNFCITNSIDSVIPMHEFEVEPMAKSSVLFNEYGIHVLLPSDNQLFKYISNEKNTYQNFAVFVHGECVFASGNEIFIKREEELNGVFGYNTADDDFKLFTL
ncbi:hypothetical protein EZJ43_08670 [Pedobacter changchengzhani]|uniref:Uncharacterized protein n=1 Tax=Pedobacter changchengzhani TaxID=2529274 RepID=A0A4R5MLE6_9SPHI|nr:hypothetical protein [Pedobacter changchengzhani]TDG36577.1 hypothetical protein EZJ43_08670 [Pedobacter changchengzhani]